MTNRTDYVYFASGSNHGGEIDDYTSSQIVDDLFVGVSTAQNNGFVFTETVRMRKRETLVRACASMYDDQGRWVGGFGRASK